MYADRDLGSFITHLQARMARGCGIAAWLTGEYGGTWDN